MLAIFVFLLGLIIGSFLAAYAYRKPLDIAISKGRSFCPNCKHSLAWYDNIPLFSYLFLRGKCRYCHKTISPRYFLIELSTGILFLLTYLNLFRISSNLVFLPSSHLLSLVVLLILVSLFVFIFVVDLEHQLILDDAVFAGLGFVILLYFLTSTPLITNLLAGFCASLFLLIIYFATRGRGMGLGDVKFAILGGLILGPSLTVSWMFLSFILGGIIGIFLLLTKSAKLKDKIAFGPFLIAGLFITIYLGSGIILV